MAQKTRALIARAEQLYLISADTYFQRSIQNNLLRHHGIPHLSRDHTQILTRAARMRTYLQTQPETTFVDLQTTIKDCRTILDGKVDHVDVPRIRNIGSLESIGSVILNTLKKPSSSDTDPMHLQNPANPIATRKPRVAVDYQRAPNEKRWKPQPPMTADGPIMNEPESTDSKSASTASKPITPIPSVNANVIGDNQNPFTQYTKQILEAYTRPAVKTSTRNLKVGRTWKPKPPTTSGLLGTPKTSSSEPSELPLESADSPASGQDSSSDSEAASPNTDDVSTTAAAATAS